MPETTALGAAMAAGAAEGVSVWSLRPEDLSHGTTDTFRPQIGDDGTAAAGGGGDLRGRRDRGTVRHGRENQGPCMDKRS